MRSKVKRLAVVVIAMLLSTGAAAQAAGRVVGTWLFVSSVRDSDNGKIDTYGAGAEGRMTLDSGGRYSITIIGANLPKFASGAVFRGTAEENAAVLGRSNAHFGTYSVDEAGTAIIFRTERGTFPNGDGTEQKRSFALVGEELSYVIPIGGGRTSVVTWRRAN
jgi:hypothetical protein